MFIQSAAHLNTFFQAKLQILKSRKRKNVHVVKKLDFCLQRYCVQKHRCDTFFRYGFVCISFVCIGVHGATPCKSMWPPPCVVFTKLTVGSVFAREQHLLHFGLPSLALAPPLALIRLL